MSRSSCFGVVRTNRKPLVLPQAIRNQDRIASADRTEDERQGELILIGPFGVFLPPEPVHSLEPFGRRLPPDDDAAGVKSAVRRNDRLVSFDLREDGHVPILEHLMLIRASS